MRHVPHLSRAFLRERWETTMDPHKAGSRRLDGMVLVDGGVVQVVLVPLGAAGMTLSADESGKVRFRMLIGSF